MTKSPIFWCDFTVDTNIIYLPYVECNMPSLPPPNSSISFGYDIIGKYYEECIEHKETPDIQSTIKRVRDFYPLEEYDDEEVISEFTYGGTYCNGLDIIWKTTEKITYFINKDNYNRFS